MKKEGKTNISKVNDIHKKKIIRISADYKSIFREYRSLYNVYKKSEYIIQLKDIKKVINKNTIEIDFIFQDEGIDLFFLINSKAFDYKKENNLIKWILFQILKGLETLHSLNIIHRDINPFHILINNKGEVKIIGLSHSINDIESKFVEDKIIGNLAYIAPECLISHHYNNKIDIWSVGVLMLELYYKKTSFFSLNLNDEKKECPELFFNQLKYLSNYFGIPFSDDFIFNNVNLKEELNTWLSTAKSNNFDEIFGEIPDIDEDGLELLKGLLAFNPKERITAKEALKSKYFKDFQYLNKEEYKKSKIKENEDLSFFVKNLEKEFQKADKLPLERKNEIFQKEVNNICQNKFVGKNI